MKKKVITCLCTMALIVIFPILTSAESFGPDEWNQYRLKSDKNAVFNNDSEPLNSQTYQTKDQIRATPVVVGNKLFVGNHNTGDLFAFDVRTGEELWHSQAPNWVHSEMIYHDGKVFVGFGNRYFQENGIRGTEESGVMALDAEDGEVLWKFNTEGEVMPTPAYYDGSVYIVTGDRHLYKLNPENGELLHKEDIGSTVSMSAPNIYEDTIYFGGSGPLPYTFSAYNLQTDEIKWQTEFPDVFSGLDDVPPAIANGIIVTTALEKADDGENPEHFMYAMDVESGEILWKESLGVGEMVKNNKSGAPMIYEDKVFVGSPITKTFYAYDLKTGEKLWQFENEVMKAPPVAQDGVVYFANTKGYVIALDAETGELTGKKKLNGKLSPSGPIIINDTMFIGSQDSNVYAFPLTDFTQTSSEKNTQNASKDDSGNGTSYIIIGILAVILIVLIALMLRKRSRKR
ncbi:hypothetical protein CFK37_08205 [Virgibacillus phasianinus]|uniref:Pyrrolo-quinoline quinone repeat domain-containing protein n=1 Tax=Virgibacillus phasianinus TaxID=2017483 RepID=A0A220U1X7_9BACI|nr:PQQ-binding-like beta-propeller repeat protein [Virgibacillus phasianinus]ASK62148.1 hypothetical protein CFK37_08205 [Virgibacillus phasianinus]